MAKVKFSELNMKIPEDVKTFIFNNQTIEVKQYLSLNDKNTLLGVAAQAATQGTTFNPLAFDAYLHLYLVMYLTNVEFSEEDLEELPILYDLMDSNDFIPKVLGNTNKDMYKNILDMAEETKNILIQYQTSVAKVVDNIEQFAPDTAGKISKELSDFDISKYEQVVNIARGAGAQI